MLAIPPRSTIQMTGTKDSLLVIRSNDAPTAINMKGPKRKPVSSLSFENWPPPSLAKGIRRVRNPKKLRDRLS